MTILAVLFAPTVWARDLVLNEQVRVTDALGEAVVGTTPTVVALHSDATLDAPLWTSQTLTPTYEDGYASLTLDTGLGGAAIESDWFAAPVWMEITVGGQTMTPRLRVRDVPVYVAPEVRRITIQGSDWASVDTLHSSGVVTAEGVTFGTGAANDVLVRHQLAPAGAFPTGVLVELRLGFQHVTSDSDPTFWITDLADGAGPEACGLRVLDQDGIIAYGASEGAIPGTEIGRRGVGSTAGSSHDFLVLEASWFLPPGGNPQNGSVTGTVESTSMPAECPVNMNVENGVYFQVTRDDAAERYRLESLHVQLTPL